MRTNRTHFQCHVTLTSGLKSGLIIRNGHYYRKGDSKKVGRFYCKSCSAYFSYATDSETRYQKSRRITPMLRKLFCSNVSQRQAARILGVNPKTVVRRFRFFANQERLAHSEWLKKTYSPNSLLNIQFDDLETSEHTKCKPLSVSLAVDPETRKILSYQVSQMPAKGLLARKAIQKYGYRKDKRSEGWNLMMEELIPYAHPNVNFKSDENPHYPRFVLKHHPSATHTQTKGGRGSVAGQGELKKLRYDPIFALNHTCAMLRANMSRLIRKTWCNTKNIQGLRDHLAIYVAHHNRVRTPALPAG